MHLRTALINLPSIQSLEAWMWAFGSGRADMMEDQYAVDTDPATAQAQRDYYRKRKEACTGSDIGWIGYKAHETFWQVVCQIHETAAITGPENLPDLPAPAVDLLSSFDKITRLEQYGEQLLKTAKQTVNV